MSEIKLTRVDDRLIHAQILLLWVKTTNINTIVLVDDEVANNPFLAEIYRLAMPTHIRLHVKTVEEAITYDYSSEPELWHDRRTLVLMKTLDTAYRLLDAGFPIESLQIGGSVVEQETDRKKTTRHPTEPISSAAFLPDKCERDDILPKKPTDSEGVRKQGARQLETGRGVYADSELPPHQSPTPIRLWAKSFRQIPRSSSRAQGPGGRGRHRRSRSRDRRAPRCSLSPPALPGGGRRCARGR